MSAIEKFGGELATGLSSVKFDNDFGSEPIGLAAVTDDKAVVTVVSGLATFIAMSYLGAPGLFLAGTIALNDFLYLSKGKKTKDIETDDSTVGTTLSIEPETINVPSQTVLPNPVTVSTPTPIEIEPTSTQPTVIESSQTIAAKPKFASFDNSSIARPSFVSPQVSTMKIEKERPTALSVFLSDPYESRCIFGAQRTGKSYFAAVVSSIQSKLETRIYHVNLASYGTEDSIYWQHAYKSLCCDISSMDSFDAGFKIEQATKLIFEFYADPNPSILIVDEIAYLGSTGNYHKEALTKMLNVIADKITVLSSSGKKRKKAIWTIAPEFVAGAVTQDTKAIKKLTLCYLTIHPDKTVDWEGQDIGFNSSLFDQIKNNYPIFYPNDLPNNDRVAFIGNEWMSIGDLPSLDKPKSETKVTITKSSESIRDIYNRLLTEATLSKNLVLFRELKVMSDLSDPKVIDRINELNSIPC